MAISDMYSRFFVLRAYGGVYNPEDRPRTVVLPPLVICPFFVTLFITQRSRGSFLPHSVA
jgi:hypothetical protein